MTVPRSIRASPSHQSFALEGHNFLADALSPVLSSAPTTLIPPPPDTSFLTLSVPFPRMSTASFGLGFTYLSAPQPGLPPFPTLILISPFSFVSRHGISFHQSVNFG